ncbi:MAG TPA: hypothetical protein VE616_11180, partial [Candidatus Udaeobacter sp.]|nr:hypothetical protein [Candidatus Udaeobacter sp.]
RFLRGKDSSSAIKMLTLTFIWISPPASKPKLGLHRQNAGSGFAASFADRFRKAYANFLELAKALETS